MPRSGLALLDMPDIKTLNALTINYDTIGRHLALNGNPDESQRNYKSEKAVQTEGGKPESCTNNRQNVDAYKTV